MITKTQYYFDIEPIIEQVKQMTIDRWDTQLNETEGNLLSGTYTVKEQYVNTPLGNVLETLSKELDIGEARLLKLSSEEAYAAHCDPDDRYHLSIISNEHSYLLDLESKTMHSLPTDGYIYHMDTGITHTAVNVGPYDRVQLNIRQRMPKCHDDPYYLVFEGEKFDGWRHYLYYDLMKYLNRRIKDKGVTGLEKITHTELLINCSVDVLEDISSMANSIGWTVKEKL